MLRGMSKIVKAYHFVTLHGQTLAAGSGERTAPRTAPARVKLADAGENHMFRGPAYRLEDPAAVAAASLRDTTDLVIDYEHGSDFRAPKGETAPAAGWIKKLSAEPDGLYAEVEWTDRARAMIEAGEYRYISPTFMADKKTGVIKQLLRAGLTNNPAFDLPALASAHHITPEDEERTMDETLKAALCSLLGLDPSSTDDQTLVTAAAKLKGAALLSADDLKQIGDALDTEDTITGAVILASLQAGNKPKNPDPKNPDQKHPDTARPDPARYVEVGVMKSVQDELGSVKKELASLQADKGRDAAETKVAAAIRDGKLVPGQKDWALSLASSDAESFDAYIKGAPTILDGGRTVTLAKSGDGGEALTAQQKAICSQLGMSEDTFLGKGQGGDSGDDKKKAS